MRQLLILLLLLVVAFLAAALAGLLSVVHFVPWQPMELQLAVVVLAVLVPFSLLGVAAFKIQRGEPLVQRLHGTAWLVIIVSALGVGLLTMTHGFSSYDVKTMAGRMYARVVSTPSPQEAAVSTAQEGGTMAFKAPDFDWSEDELCRQVVQNQDGVTDVQKAEFYLYWAVPAGIRSRMSSKATYLMPTQGGVRAFYVGPKQLLWSEGGTPGIWLGGHTGSDRVKVLEDTAESAIVADDVFIYWTTATHVMRARMDGSDVTTLATGQSQPRALTLATDHLYWLQGAAGGPGSLMRVARGGGPLVAVGTAEKGLSGLAVDSGHVYWSSAASGTLWRAPHAGGDTRVVVDQQVGIGLVGLSGANVYWLRNASGGEAAGFYEMPKEGGAAKQLTKQVSNPVSLYLKQGCFFWADPPYRHIASLCPPAS